MLAMFGPYTKATYVLHTLQVGATTTLNKIIKYYIEIYYCHWLRFCDSNWFSYHTHRPVALHPP